MTSGARSANAQEPGADRALDLFEGPAEHLGGLVESEPLARAENPRHALPVTHNRQRPTRIPTNLHAHGVTVPLSLRHTFASRLVMAGVDLLTVMQLGGWKSLAMVSATGICRQAIGRTPSSILSVARPPWKSRLLPARSSNVITTNGNARIRSVAEVLVVTGAGGGS